MDKGLIAVTMIPTMLVAVIGLGIPFYYAMAGVALFYGVSLFGAPVFPIIAIRVYGFVMEGVFIAVPMFVLMGTILGGTGVAEMLFLGIYKVFGPVRGGLLVAVGIICTLMAACTGVAAGPVATMGLIALPMMLKSKYEIGISTACIAACGTLGTIIPPSVLLVLYGMNSEVSIGRIYFAAMVPGVVLAVVYMAYMLIKAWVSPYDAPAMPEEERGGSAKEMVKLVVLGIMPIFFLIFVVLGTIFMGVATATEAAGVGAFGALIIAAAYRKLTWRSFTTALRGCYRTTGMIGGITIGANFFASVFLKAGGGDAVNKVLLGAGLSPMGIMWGVLVINFSLGFVMNNTAIVLVLIPIFWPMLRKLGITDVWFAVLFCLMSQTAYLTPPFAPGVYTLKPLCPPEVELTTMYKGIAPFIIVQFVTIAIVYLYPPLATWLPEQLIKSSGK